MEKKKRHNICTTTTTGEHYHHTNICFMLRIFSFFLSLFHVGVSLTHPCTAASPGIKFDSFMLSVKNFFSMWKVRVSRVLKSSPFWITFFFLPGLGLLLWYRDASFWGVKIVAQQQSFLLLLRCFCFPFFPVGDDVFNTKHIIKKSCVLTCDHFSHNIFPFRHVWVRRCRDEIHFSPVHLIAVGVRTLRSKMLFFLG